MSKIIISREDGFELTLISLWGGNVRGPCIQINLPYMHSHHTMTRKEAIHFFETALKRLTEQETRLQEMVRAATAKFYGKQSFEDE